MSFDDRASHIYIVTMLTESRLVYMDKDGDSYSFSRQFNALGGIIGGKFAGKGRN